MHARFLALASALYEALPRRILKGALFAVFNSQDDPTNYLIPSDPLVNQKFLRTFADNRW